MIKNYFIFQLYKRCSKILLNKKHIPKRITNFSLKNAIFKSLKTSYNQIPLLFGNNKLEINDQYIKIGVDIFGTVFFMLSRYEELFQKIRCS